MRLHISKSKNAESFYISKGYVNDKVVSTSVIVHKLGTLKEPLPEHGPTRDDVVAWCKEQCKLETQNIRKNREVNPFRLHSMLTGRSITNIRFSTVADIYFSSHFTTGFSWTRFSEN